MKAKRSLSGRFAGCLWRGVHAIVVCCHCAAQVPIGLIKGRALSIIWPPARLGLLDSRIPRYRVRTADGRLLP